MVLEALATQVATIPRKRHKMDVAAWTNPICELLLAWGFGRQGERGRAADLLGAALPKLTGEADPLLQLVGAVLGQRVRDTLDGKSFPGALPQPAAPLSLFQVYKFERLRGGSRVIEPAVHADVIPAFHAKTLQLFGGGAPITDEPLADSERAHLVAGPKDWPRFLPILRRASFAMSPGELAGYASHWAEATDKFNTTSHFSLVAVELVDTLVYATAR